MVYSGYILPPKNQKIYNEDVKLALENYNKDLLFTSLDKSNIVDLVNSKKESTQIVNKIVDDIVNKVDTSNSSITNIGNLSVRTTESAAPSPTSSSKSLSPKERAILSSINAKESELKRPLTPEEKIDVENKIDQQTKLSSEILSKGEVKLKSRNNSPSSTATTFDTTKTLDDLRDEINKLDSVKKDKKITALKHNYIKELLIREIKAGNTIYAASGPNQRYIHKDKLLTLKDNEFYVNEEPFNEYLLLTTFKINLNPQQETITSGKGMAAKNLKKNFGNYIISLTGLRKGNLSIYRPKTNSIVIRRRNLSPTLLKIINSIRTDMSFKLEDYDRLIKPEQKTVDHIINLLRLDYPPKMKRALDEENWNLKQRYEILLSEINAGNGGYMVMQELKDVLAKLKENKVINKKKYDIIMSALNE